MLTFAVTAATVGAAAGGGGATTMWKILDFGSDRSPARAFRTIFGECGDRGEYMDGYTERAMVERCAEDYGWPRVGPDGDGRLACERAAMMSHLYDDERLWDHVSMVAFAEHYATEDSDGGGTGGALATFRRRRNAQPRDRPIFAGAVLRDWEAGDGAEAGGRLEELQARGIDYVRLDCNLGTVGDIGGAAEIADSPAIVGRFARLAEAARRCQDQEMVPLVLLQFPWRDPGDSIEYFNRAVQGFADALRDAGVDPERLLFETRPPVGLSALEEKGMSETERTLLGLEVGRIMFEVIETAFDGKRIAGFCVAGGSTKGDNPTAMEDDTQNAVRQGMRRIALERWGYEVCFWEMGAKRMLQPQVGRLWGGGKDRTGRDAAQKLFCLNAQEMADEIKASLSP